ncbi:DUF3021 family protein [Paenibacillus ferrarius]|uniref:DUF3021 family protein n=1 Tax=Paenibacillus ferrarius TaxID=1469647 RepID=UPI003D2C9A4F
MRLMEFTKNVVRQFFLVFALIIIILTLLRQWYQPDMPFDLHSIYIIMGFSLVAALTDFIKYAPHTISENNMRLRMIFHFIALETILIALGLVTGIVESAANASILAIQIAVIYGILRLLSWRNDKKTAEDINQRLKEISKL